MKKPRTKINLPLALAWGLLGSLAVTLAGAAGIAFLITGEQIAPENGAVAVVAILIPASVLGAWIAVRGAGEKPLVVGLLSGGLYYLSLLCCTALFFDGQYRGLGITALAVMGGSLATVLLTLRTGGKKRRKRYRVG